jgi:hypothetical protein
MKTDHDKISDLLDLGIREIMRGDADFDERVVRVCAIQTRQDVALLCHLMSSAISKLHTIMLFVIVIQIMGFIFLFRFLWSP